jgi:adenosylcobinamide-GDP ribazoletransferase
MQKRLTDLKTGFAFLTRLPLAQERPIAGGELATALWTAPIVGAIVGLIGSFAYWLAHSLHLPPLVSATLAVASTFVFTGGLHEDGLADVADGFGGGATRERKLEIMRDSRIGTYGVCALVLSLLLRVAVVANLGEPALVAGALVAAHAAARSPLAAFMRLLPPARADGMSADVGEPPAGVAVASLLLGLFIVVIALGPMAVLAAAILIAAAFLLVGWLCTNQIKGQTGDVLGTLEQAGEIIVLLVAAAGALR